jgi:CRP-like cAMP-binding protein
MARLPLQASADLQQELRKISIPLRLTKSSLLFEQGERPKGVYLVESGSIALLLKLVRGRTVYERDVGKGSVLGLPATVNDTAYSLTAKALCEVDLAFVPRENLIEAMNKNISLAVEILKVLSQEVQAMRDVIRTRWQPGGSARKHPSASSSVWRRLRPSE